MNKKEKMVAALQQNLEVVKKTSEDLDQVNENEPVHELIIADTEEDYRYARERIKKLIAASEDAIAGIANLAADTEHPRAFEVLGALIKQAAEMNQQLLDLQRQRKTLVQDTASKGNSNQTTNNAIFVGTTLELQKFLTSQKNKEVALA
jgi:primosomal replication protein N